MEIHIRQAEERSIFGCGNVVSRIGRSIKNREKLPENRNDHTTMVRVESCAARAKRLKME